MAVTIYEVFEGGMASLADYLSAHVITCLVPAFFIAGAIAVFISKEGVIKYFGRNVPRYVSYAIASVSGTVLAVCSCTILPLFAGIYKRGAGIGPATAFLYSGPAINVLAIIYTARSLGYDLGLARAIAAISMAVVVGLSMEMLFERNKRYKGNSQSSEDATGVEGDTFTGSRRPKWAVPVLFVFLVVVLVFGASTLPIRLKISIVSIGMTGIALIIAMYLTPDELEDWGYETYDLTKKILPFLIIGTFVVGMIAVLLPPGSFEPYLGDNSVQACLLGAVIGTILYMPTLLEVPIIGETFGYSDGVMASGPALSLLLAGPAVSLPSLLVLSRILGPKRTGVFAVIVIIASTIAGTVYGNLA